MALGGPFRWLTLPICVVAQYDFPVDSCACHIFYEHWVQMQLVISKVLTPDFPEKVLDEKSGVREAIAFDSCQDLRKVKNSLAWTVSTAAQTDCTFIMCSQLALLKNDFELALMYSEIANYQLPFASNCMDPGQWTIRPEDVLENHRKMLRFSLEFPTGDLTRDQVKRLLWQPVTGISAQSRPVIVQSSAPLKRDMSDTRHLMVADEECGTYHETGRSSPWKRWVYGISAALAVAAVATLVIFKSGSPGVASGQMRPQELFAKDLVKACPAGHFHQCPSEWKASGNAGGYHCLHKLARQTSQKAYESSGGACRPAKEGPFPFDDCQDQCGIGATVQYEPHHVVGHLEREVHVHHYGHHAHHAWS